MSSSGNDKRTRDFLNTGSQFRLGDLVTESPHLRTFDLSQKCQNDLPHAAEIFRDVEYNALKLLLKTEDLAEELITALEKVLAKGRRIFLCGCGATGRLSLVLESVWRQAPLAGHDDSVVAFTAGGDYALVRSLGVFEDRPELGARHLLDLGFQNGDILIAITEGGETPFVLGALDQATKTSTVKSWLFFCNPPKLLSELVDRSRQAMENPCVRWHAFDCGPMALTGSTRLQASSVLMAFVGACFREIASDQKSRWVLSDLLDRVAQVDTKSLVPLIEIESQTHLDGGFTLHRSRSAAMPVLTDTTERAPTFSLAPFESSLEITGSKLAAPSRTYLEIPRAKSSLEAWHHLLRRDPRPFTPPADLAHLNISMDAIIGFDFSDGVAARRKSYGVETQTILDVEFGDYDHTTPGPTLLFRTTEGDRKTLVTVPSSADPLVRQSQMKYVLNLQSTLAMGRIGRFQGNLMTFVRPTNNKLIDRALRTLRALAQIEARNTGNEKLQNLVFHHNDEPFLNAIFQAVDTVSPDEPVTLKALRILT